MADIFIPYNKLSKKKQKQHNAKQRQDFGTVKPIGIVFKSKKDYNRKKLKEQIRKGNFDE